MKLLGWMHRKLRQNTHDTTPPNDFPIGQSTLDDLQCYQNENYGSKPFVKAQRDNNRSSFARVEHEEDDIAELFHGFLAIGTLGTKQLFTTTDPAATPTFDHMIAEKETEVTENEFKQINDELEKVLGDDVSSGRNSKVSTDQKPSIESADTCPLQSYLFGSKIGDAETTQVQVRKEQRTSLGELFEKTKEAEDINNSHVTKSVSDKSAVHVMKKMLKKRIHVHSSSKSSTGGAKIGCTATDKKLHKKTQTYRLYQFLHGADVVFDAVKRDLLKESPLPTVEMAYSALRREAARVVIVNPPAANDEIGTGLAARNLKNRPSQKNNNNRTSNKAETNQSAADSQLEKAKLRCDHCGKMGHLKKSCFELVGYPDWFENNPKFANKYKKGAVAAATGMTKGDGSIDGGDGELGFAAAALVSKLGGNRKATILGSKSAAPGAKKPRVGDGDRRSNHSRPPAAAIVTPTVKQRAAKSEEIGTLSTKSGGDGAHRGNRSRSPAAATTNPPPQFAKPDTPTPIVKRDEDVMELKSRGQSEIKRGLNQFGPHVEVESSGLCVPLGPLDMYGIDPMDDENELGDFLNKEDDGLDEIGPAQKKDTSPPDVKTGHKNEEDHWAWH